MTPYTVRIGANPPFEVMGEDSFSVAEQYIDLCGEGEKISVCFGWWAERWWDERNDARAAALDLRQRDVQDVISRGNV